MPFHAVSVPVCRRRYGLHLRTRRGDKGALILAIIVLAIMGAVSKRTAS